MIATPAHAATVPEYALSLAGTCRLLSEHGIDAAPTVVSGGAHIDLVRNEIAEAVRVSDADLAVLIDADQSWEPADAARFVQGAIVARVDVAGVPVPRKAINWRAVGAAARAGAPDELLAEVGVGAAGWWVEFEREHVSGSMGYVGPTREASTPWGAVRFVRVRRISTGFLAVRPAVLDRIIAVRGDELAFQRAGQQRHHIFASGLAPSPAGGRMWVGEDHSFAVLCRDLGIEAWAWLEAVVTHHGAFEYRGRFDLHAEARRAAGGGR